MATTWYLEAHKKGAAQNNLVEHITLEAAADALEWAKNRMGPEIIIRVRAPTSATDAELGSFKQLGAIIPN